MTRPTTVVNPESRTKAAVVNSIIADMVSQTDTNDQALASNLNLASGKAIKYDGVALTASDHTLIANIGTNTHAQIDTHLGAAAPHTGHEVLTDKGAASGYCPLDSGTKIDTSYLPAITETEITLSDVTTNDASTDNHGFLKKLSGNASDVFNGVGAWIALSTSGTKQVLSGGSYTDLSTSATQYLPLNSRTSPSADPTDFYYLFPCAGTLRNAYAILDAAPNGAGKTRTFTIYKNGATTDITMTITNAATTQNDLTHTVAIEAGDVVCWKSEVANTPDAADAYLGLEFYPSLAATNYNNFTAGEAIAQYEVVYMKSDGKIWKAKADAESTTPAFAVALEAIAQDTTGDVQTLGSLTNTSWTWTAGDLLYLSPSTGGALTATIPTTSGHIIQVVALALSATKILLSGNFNTVEIA